MTTTIDSGELVAADDQVSRYAWSNEWNQAERRLALLQEFADPGTIACLKKIGVGSGWSCLEVAAGAGSIARWLCERVGPEGRVVATDLEPRFLERLEPKRLQVVRHDVRTQPLPSGFDLVHTRTLLMHLPERERIVDSLVAAVAPGGWLLLEDADLYPMAALGGATYAFAWEALCRRTAETTGLSTSWGRRLPEVLAARGLADVSATAVTRLFPGGSTHAEWVALTWQQALEQVRLPPAEAAEVARAQRELEDPSRWFPLPAIVSAWGRRVARQ